MWLIGQSKSTFKSTLTTRGITSGMSTTTMLGKDVPRVKVRPETVTVWTTSVMEIVGWMLMLGVMWVMKVMRAVMVTQAMRTINSS